MSTLELVLREPWVARLGWTLVHFLWQGTLIAVLFTAVRGLVGHALTARGRYVLACLALGIMMITPLLTFLAAENLGEGAVPAPVWRVSGGDAWERALPWLVVAWVGGVGLFSARLIGGWRLTARLRSVAVGPAPREWQQTLEALIRRLRVSAPVRLLTSSLVAVPTVVGWLRPVILVPVEALTGLPIEQVQALLAHELAHIRRHDYLVNIVQSIAEAVLFYHPAVWWVSDQIRTERELCCDDLAVAASGDVLVYARALADLESHRRARLKAALAADGGSLVNRIRRLVGQSQPLSHTLPGPGAAWALTVLWVAGIGAATVHGAPGSSTHPRNFVLSPPVVAEGVAAAPLPLEPPSAIQHLAAAPVVTALLFDPFFEQPQVFAPPPASETQPKKARVEGTVVNLAGDPVKRASVRLAILGASASTQTVTAYSEITDDAGKFAIEDVPPGSYTLSATKVGYITGSYGARAAGAPGTPIRLAEGAALKDLGIKLTPQAIVSGRVTDADGEPVANAGVSLYPPDSLRGREPTLAVAALSRRGQANALGSFSIGEIPPGRYYLAVSPVEQSPYAEAGTTDLSTYYPSALDPSGAVALDVAAGARLQGIDVRLRRERVYRVRGTVTLNGGLVNSTLLMMTSSGGWIRHVHVRDGAFEVGGLVADSYTLKVVPEGIVPSIMGYTLGLSGGVEVDVKDRNVDGVVLALEPGVEVSGSFKLEDGQALSTLSGIQPQLALVPTDGSGAGMPRRADGDGAFQLAPTAVGQYLLDVTGLPQGTYVKSAHFGAQDVTRSPLNLTSGGGTLEIDLSAKAAAVTGTLRNDKGEALSGILVTVWPKVFNPGTATHGISSVHTDQSGAFTVGGLAPGGYYVAAWEEIKPDLAKNPDFLVAFSGDAVEVKLSESSKASAAVKLIAKDKIAAEASKPR
jgi:beta-lactamase regulating signal transducer with metallopeptidase domain